MGRVRLVHEAICIENVDNLRYQRQQYMFKTHLLQTNPVIKLMQAE